MGGFESLLAFVFLCVFLSQQIILPKGNSHNFPHIMYQPFLPTTLDLIHHLAFCQKVEEEEAEEVEVEEEPPKAELTPEARQNTRGWKGSQELGVTNHK